MTNPNPPKAPAPPPPPASSPPPELQTPEEKPLTFLDYVEGAPRVPAVAHALRIAFLYFLFGVVWIAASDYALNLLIKAFGNTWLFNQTVKGWFFITFTAFLLFLALRHFLRTLQKSHADMQHRLEGVAEQYRMFFHRNPSAMIIFDPTNRKILAANDVALLLYGYPREDLLNMTTLDLVVEEERSRLVASTVYKKGVVQTVGPVQVRRRDGSIIFVEAMTHEVAFNSKPARIALVSDVTERLRSERALSLYRGQLEQRVAERTTELSRANQRLRQEVQERLRMEEDLRAATAVAEAANIAKSTFLAQTSHEIRTPLTSILGYAELLQGDKLSPDERAHYLRVVHHNAAHLSALIDDLLDLSRAQAGNLKLAPADHGPHELATEAMEQLRTRAADKGLELSAEIAPGLPETIHADGLRVRQILLNLMDNAIKFTQEGFVRLRVRRAITDGKEAVRFEVADSGMGIAPDYLENIFEPFFQVEQGSTRRFGGSGLGLSVSRQLAMLMGGDLAVTSNPGQGSVFTFTLPIDPKQTLPSSRSPEAAPDRDLTLTGTILLAEDNDNIRLLVHEYLTRAGASVIGVTNGQQAVDAMRESLASSGPHIDLVLLDLHMPVLDGLNAMRQIRNMRYAGPIVGLTADFAENQTQQRSNEGWDAMCAKPINRQVFLPLLARLMEKKNESNGSPR